MVSDPTIACPPIHSVCVFAASSNAVGPAFMTAARELGELLARHRLTLVYGGGKVGLMGVVARAVHDCCGRVVGVLPGYLRTAELAYEAADELLITNDLRERKAVMEARSDAVVVLPGGFGTLEEALEMLTLKQLRQHHKPVVFLNTAGFFDPLLAMFERLYTERFARPENAALYEVAPSPAAVIERLTTYRPSPVSGKWL